MLKADIDKDLKVAMLSGDKRLVEVLRGLKSAILYKEVADGKRDSGLSDAEIVAVFKKEQKSRKDAIAIYEQAEERARADEEKYQIDVIGKYMPDEISEDVISAAVKTALIDLGISTPEPKDMGRIIGAVKQALPTADGSTISNIVKQSIK